MNVLQKKIRLLPNVITAFGLSCGLFVVFKMSRTPFVEVDYAFVIKMAGILLLAAFADALDGAVARAMHAESDFGGLFDSLADSISFGVAPSLLVMQTFKPGSDYVFLVVAAMVFSMCGVLRLVRFSVVRELEKEREDLAVVNKRYFSGLPIPAAAAALISFALCFLVPGRPFLLRLAEYDRMWALFSIMMVLGYLMVSRLKFPSLKTLHIRIASFQLLFFTVVGAVFFVYGILNYFTYVFAALFWGYIFISLFLSLIRFVTGKRVETLSDFDPDPETLDFE